ncbi:MAG: glycine--tRNA ligase subunit beta [Deltaproteobacteria bacterium]|nr:glycine--tRNA ligase subunit beta [Deltaproteobacteria bacterium]
MAAELLLEIGTEEIPSGYLDDALDAMRSLAGAFFKENRIESSGDLRVFGTPRRMVLTAAALEEKQEDAVQEVTGPPKKAAFDPEGNPTKAALGFAAKHGLSVDQLQILNTPKGEYLYVRRTTPGRPTMEVLAEVLPKLIADLPWPKSMRWGNQSFSFVRPIHWVVALFGGKVIPIEIAGIASGNTTRGHRFMAPEAVAVDGFRDFAEKLEARYVLIDGARRAEKIRDAAKIAAEALEASPITDPDLLATVSNMVEYPSVICGSFDPAYLAIPSPVLISAMKKHQKYFAVQDGAGKLMPHFIAVNNTIARSEEVVRKGHERVLRARLSDASFFFQEDRKKPLEARLDDLKGVIYQAQLGTSYAKVQRFSRLSEFLARQSAPDKTDQVKLAAGLSKCDLVTGMVTEFPDLQGIMGTEYARLDGHPEDVCLAIREHYLPTRAGEELPSTEIGALVGIADRMDTIVGFFAIGSEPTGAADPFALRRHALAVLRILEERDWDISLTDFITESVALLAEEIPCDRQRTVIRVKDFFRERYKQMMLRSEYSSDLVEAVISVEFDHIGHIRPRCDQLQEFLKEFGEFESLLRTFKRVTNILKNQEPSSGVDPSLFREPCEAALLQAYQDVKGEIEAFTKEKRYAAALNLMAGLRGPVDVFFEGVEILTKENEAVKNNRVALLQELSLLFLKVADFSKFSV